MTRRTLPLAAILLLLPVASEAAEALSGGTTYSEQIAPLLFEHCAVCHRPGQVAPFSLLTYDDARKHAKTMLRVMQDRYMPPWQPEAGYGEFRDERRLSDEQIALFQSWASAGMPQGDPLRTPAVPKFPEGWRLGQPDLIVKMDRPFKMPADGPDIYQNFVLPLGLSEDKWVTAVEFRASAPQVVHHVLYFTDDSGRARAKAPAEGQPGFPGMGFRPTGRLGGWAVGATPVRLPDGLAYPLSKASDLVLQTHFHPTGKAEEQTLTVGIYFADKAPTRTLVALPLPPAFGLFSRIDLPPGDADFTISDSFTLPVDVDLVSVGGHAHYLGKTMRSTASLPDGAEQKLFSIRDWNFNWQGQYVYKDFVRLPKGTVMHATISWDNSSANPRNPSSPPVHVTWGEQTIDEMGQVTFLAVAAKESDTNKLRTAVRAHLRETVIESRLRGDFIDWEKLGLPRPAFWPAPATQPAKP